MAIRKLRIPSTRKL